MKSLIYVMTLLLTLSVQAGVGGIEGGHIHFQKNSTWVNSFYSKSLCHDRFEYKAVVSLCSKWKNDGDGRRCVLKEMKEIFQPLESTRMRCKHKEDSSCIEWEEVKYYQNPKRLLKFKDKDDNIIKKQKYTIPECR